ncbi:hypothetical protein IMZ48_16760, partial [Candidatus Bathyarchaeota archaeon]|nr:hypothetical protein [Candidatus Bathyarchaeota archaeon]
MITGAILLSVLAATATASHAHAPSLRQLRPRQVETTDGAPTPTTPSRSSTITGEPIPFCSDIFESLVTRLPPMPTEALDFSESYYETATRTASETLSDCAW